MMPKDAMMPHAEPSFALAALLGQSIPCTCGVQHVVPTREVVLETDALLQVPAVCARHFSGQRVLLLDDAITHDIAGARVSQLLQQNGYDVEGLTLPIPANTRVLADDHTLATVQASLHSDIDFVLAVGAGTVNDLAKLASFRADRPYMVCPTAASMNGFTSAIAAILSRGVKRTVPARPPVAIVADMHILATAPLSMMRAGLGDMLSKAVSTADWKLAHLIKEDYYCELPLKMVEQAEQACRGHAACIGRGTPEGLRALTEALLLSGISMVVAGSSSPASGGEHLISHYWDMTAHRHGRQEQLHGAQVGVATLVTATLYEKLQQLDPACIELKRLHQQYPDWPRVEQDLRRLHGPLGDEVVVEARKKYLPLAEKTTEWRFILNHWTSIWSALQDILLPPDRLRQVLLAASAPTTIRELGISAAEMRAAFLHARDIRGRYTVLDFAHDLGVLEALCEDVLAASGVLN
jgi:glycerol-1-phosphate dehydrogenase [NAD(P)+]